MSEKTLASVKANRIVEAEQRLDASVAKFDKATTELSKAKEKVKAAVGDAERKKAEAEVQQKTAALEDAKSQVEYERQCSDRLLNVKPPKQWSFMFFGILGAVVLGIILWGLKSDTLLGRLKDIETSRGLITFLITVVTVTIALILVLSTIVSASPDRNERFKDGKDLLFALIGVLGTIVGFYFGQATSGDAPLSLSPVVITNEAPEAGETVSLIGFISGGAAPYAYDIVFDPDEPLKAVTKERSPDGLLVQEIEIMPVEEKTDVTYTIQVSDSNGETITSDKYTLTLKPSGGDDAQ